MKKVLLIIIVTLLIIQFIQPKKNNSENNNLAIEKVEEVPLEIQNIIKKSCADCHSNNTNYPWYNNVAPISWYVANHVNEGKEHLNFSEWGGYNKYQKEHIIDDLKNVLENQSMPLKSYLLMHEDAKLSNAEYDLFLEWIKNLKVE